MLSGFLKAVLPHLSNVVSRRTPCYAWSPAAASPAKTRRRTAGSLPDYDDYTVTRECLSDRRPGVARDLFGHRPRRWSDAGGQAVIYFSADRYAAELTDYMNLLFGALAAFAIFVVGAFRAPFVARLIVAIGGAVAMFVGSFIVAMIGATVADRGGPRGNLEDGINGGIWFVLTAVFLVAIATRRWPVQQKDAPFTHGRLTNRPPIGSGS